MTLEIERMLTLSTGHVDAKTALALDDYVADTRSRQFAGLTVYPKGEYGWFIYIGMVHDDPEDWGKLPADLTAAIALAEDQDISWLCLDRDGPDVDALPKYDW